MGKLKVWRCGQKLFTFNCPMHWEHLTTTSNPNVRFCDHCKSNVYRCTTPEHFVELAQQNECVAIDHHLMNFSEAPMNLLGRPLPSSRMLEEQAIKWWHAVETSLPESGGQLIREYEKQNTRQDAASERIRYSDLDNHVRAVIGVYQIWTYSGIALKIGIADNLLGRLRKHRASRNSGLRIKGTKDTVTDGKCDRKPSDIVSKTSILAKHLLFDRSLSNEYDFATQDGRSKFLRDQCYLLVQEVSCRAEAREIEKREEKSGAFRYVGKVIER